MIWLRLSFWGGGEGRRNTKGSAGLLASTAGWVGELLAGTAKRVEEADLGARFLIFQGRWDLGGLLAECQGHKREGGTCRVPNPVLGPQKVHKW